MTPLTDAPQASPPEQAGPAQHTRDGLTAVAFWQLMTFMMLILLIWLNEITDLAALWFGSSPSTPSIFRGCVLTIGTIVVAVVTVGHTYIQQKQIISGLLIVCSTCRKIRVDTELWGHLDDYISEHSVAVISHGICPHCFDKMQKEISDMGKGQGDSAKTRNAAAPSETAR
jgi:hypothetical protein